jgi:2-keto-4-pentenoate hydratase
VSARGASGHFDPRLVSALEEQLTHRRRLLDAGATHVGWKLGMGDRESIGGEIAVGHLTSGTCLEPRSAYRTEREDAALHADAEVAVELGTDVEPDGDAASVRDAIAAYAAAVEIVDLTLLPGEPE